MNITFDVRSPEEAMSRVLSVFDSPDVGSAARSSCIVTCQGEHGRDDFLLLYHYDLTLVLDAPAGRPNDHWLRWAALVRGHRTSVNDLLMGRPARRFVAKAQKNIGWRVWDNLTRQFWGPVLQRQPDALLAELNGPRRGLELNRLVAAAKRISR